MSAVVNVQNLAVLGPNLLDQSRGQFVVHAYGCSDIGRVRDHSGPARWYTLTVSTLREVAADIYADQIDEGSMSVDDALDDIHFAPCVKLPEGE